MAEQKNIKVLCISDNPDFRRKFTENLYTDYELLVYDYKLGLDYILKDIKKLKGFDLGFIDMKLDNPLTYDYVSNLKRTYKNSNIIMTAKSAKKAARRLIDIFQAGAEAVFEGNYLLENLQELVWDNC